MAYELRQISSLEKVRLEDQPVQKEFWSKTVFRGERFSYQIAIFGDSMQEYKVTLEAPCKDWINVYNVRSCVMDHPIYPHVTDEDYITTEPGLMPDLLMPLEEQNGVVTTIGGRSTSLWIRMDVPEDAAAGVYPVTVRVERIPEEVMTCKGPGPYQEAQEKTMKVEVLPIALPEQTLGYTQWFYADCIAQVHGAEVFSERHWELIDKYMACYADLGMNMMLMPVVTPPLDTAYGRYRLCVQLVDIEKRGEEYHFDFGKVRRWIGLCKKHGIRYHEICQLFTQWGMYYTPNIQATVDGETKYIFGWDVPSEAPEYAEFLKQLIPALRQVLQEEGVEENSYFHISDEPRAHHLKTYETYSKLVSSLIGNCKRMDALSHYEFYEKGLVDVPVTGNHKIEPFLEHKLENQWVYYCMSQFRKVSNRFMAQPSYRNRIMGLQMYKFDIKGFLQWGFNYYNARCSNYPINPYLTTSSDKAFPSGDPFSVYPGADGPLLSLRALVFQEGLQDAQVCRLLERYVGKEEVVRMIDDRAGMEVRFDEYPRNAEYLLKLRSEMTEKIREFAI